MTRRAAKAERKWSEWALFTADMKCPMYQNGRACRYQFKDQALLNRRVLYPGAQVVKVIITLAATPAHTMRK